MTPANAPAGRAKLPRPRPAHEQHRGEERNGHERELLQEHRGRETGCRPGETRAAGEPEREHEEKKARRVCRSEPGCLDDERVGCEGRADRQPHGERPCERERGRDERESREQHEEPVVVERRRQETPTCGRDRRPREVGEVIERLVAELRRAVAAVEALDAGAAVVVAVRSLAVEDEIPRDLDLVRGVVRVEPGRRRVAKARLQEDARDGEQPGDEERDEERPPRRPPFTRVGEGYDEDEPRRNGGELEETRVPVAAGERDD